MAKVETLEPIPASEAARRGWRLRIDGADAADVSYLTLNHPKIGELAYGWRSDGGYDSWTFAEQGEGGVVVVPFVRVGGELLVGVVRQNRINQGGDVWNVPRGFLDPGESHAAAAARELGEETGLAGLTAKPLELAGKPANPNSTFFQTLNGRGVRFFAVEIDAADVEQDERGYHLRAGVADQELVDVSERVSELRFLGWSETACLEDMLSNAAVARLLAHLGSAPPVRQP